MTDLSQVLPVRRVLKAEHDELVDYVANVREGLAVWAERLAVTPGADARFALAALDRAAASAARAHADVRSTYRPRET